MQIKDLIKVYDNLIDVQSMCSILKFINRLNFFDAGVGGAKQDIRLDKNIRNVQTCGISNYSESKTEQHWANFLTYFFAQVVNQYKKDLRILDLNLAMRFNINALKYTEGGHYVFHIDDCFGMQRILSIIYMLNNDYEGGKLSFRNLDGTGQFDVDVAANRLIIWPSNFLFPHCVQPITKGKRFSIVGWVV
jgi:predicted 2-oxoglutarate/Fe(II)-dependent dioxygenase YbiX